MIFKRRCQEVVLIPSMVKGLFQIVKKTPCGERREASSCCLISAGNLGAGVPTHNPTSTPQHMYLRNTFHIHTESIQIDLSTPHKSQIEMGLGGLRELQAN